MATNPKKKKAVCPLQVLPFLREVVSLRTQTWDAERRFEMYLTEKVGREVLIDANDYDDLCFSVDDPLKPGELESKVTLAYATEFLEVLGIGGLKGTDQYTDTPHASDCDVWVDEPCDCVTGGGKAVCDD
jgi:hypothetical protein